jgi:hypothetical protein
VSQIVAILELAKVSLQAMASGVPSGAISIRLFELAVLISCHVVAFAYPPRAGHHRAVSAVRDEDDGGSVDSSSGVSA